MIKERTEYKTTDNRYVYNRLHKKMLEQDGLIRCTYCGYHSNENSSKKWYGGVLQIGFEGKKWGENTTPYEHWDVRHPNWKLVSKKRKQWMVKKSQKDTTYSNRGYTRYSFDFIF